MLRAVGWLIPTLPVPGSAIGGETFDTAFGDPAVGPVARADPLVCEMAPMRFGYLIGILNAMDLVKRDVPEKLKVGVEKTGLEEVSCTAVRLLDTDSPARQVFGDLNIF